MRVQFFPGLSVVALLAVLAATSAPAEAADIRCKIPFSFEVHGETLPPGTYTFSSDPAKLFIRGFRHSAFALTNNEQSTSDTQAKAVFERYGDEYVLRDVWFGGGVGRELVRPRVEPERRRTAHDGRVEIPAL